MLIHIRDEFPGPAVTGDASDQGLSAGEVSEALMRVLLEQGRLKVEQVVAAAAQQLDQPADQSSDLLRRFFFGLVQVCQYFLWLYPAYPVLEAMTRYVAMSMHHSRSF